MLHWLPDYAQRDSEKKRQQQSFLKIHRVINFSKRWTYTLVVDHRKFLFSSFSLFSILLSLPSFLFLSFRFPFLFARIQNHSHYFLPSFQRPRHTIVVVVRWKIILAALSITMKAIRIFNRNCRLEGGLSIISLQSRLATYTNKILFLLDFVFPSKLPNSLINIHVNCSAWRECNNVGYEIHDW